MIDDLVKYHQSYGEICITITYPPTKYSDDKLNTPRVEVQHMKDQWFIDDRSMEVKTRGSYAESYFLNDLRHIWHTILVDFVTMTAHPARRWIDMYSLARGIWEICDLSWLLKDTDLHVMNDVPRKLAQLCSASYQNIRFVFNGHQ